tara:strand:+ start:433 stop:1218 length:786 start_codon:yes stop_codon:yes gene_type:complete
MGNYEHMAIATKLPSSGRSVLSDAVGPDAPNVPADLSLIARALETAGLLDASAPLSDVRHQVFKAIHHVARTLSDVGGDGGPPDAPSHLAPAGTTERVFRRAVASGRFPISHRAAHQSAVKPGIHALVSGGANRARKKLATIEAKTVAIDARYRRAVLPSMSKQAFLTNRRLVQALKDGGAIPGLEVVLAQSLIQDGKQGFVNVRDFFQELDQQVPSLTSHLQQRVTAQLGSGVGRRFRKLCQGEAPVEADFPEHRPKAEP